MLYDVVVGYVVVVGVDIVVVGVGDDGRVASVADFCVGGVLVDVVVLVVGDVVAFCLCCVWWRCGCWC